MPHPNTPKGKPQQQKPRPTGGSGPKPSSGSKLST